jgi:collagen type VI alpha
MLLRLLVVSLCVACTLTAHVRSAREILEERREASRQLAELNREELLAARQWQDLVARKRELARDQGAKRLISRGLSMEERELESYLKREEQQLAMERRQIAGEKCIQGDVIFILDSSGSIKIENWKFVLNFVNEAIKRMDVSPRATRVGLVTFGNRAHIIFNLNNFTTSDEMYPIVSAARFLDENTNTSGGLYAARSIMFTEENGDRPKAPNMAIVITDGESTYDHNKTIPYAQEAKNEGILMISIGVGDKVSKDELEGIASVGGDGKPLVFQVGSYDMLIQIQDTLARVACDPIATIAPSTVEPPSTEAATTQAAPTPAKDIPVCETISPDIVKNCTAVTCKNKCQYGFAQDVDFCPTCGCLPKPFTKADCEATNTGGL